MVKLYYSTQRLDIYSTYVVVENVDNPHDLKTIHVSMRVVVSDAPASNYFAVIVDSRIKPPPSAMISEGKGPKGAHNTQCPARQCRQSPVPTDHLALFCAPQALAAIATRLTRQRSSVSTWARSIMT